MELSQKTKVGFVAQCVQVAYQHQYAELCGSISPLLFPLLNGLKREMWTQKIVYKAPCGRRLGNLNKIHDYLRETRSHISIDLFNFDVRVNCTKKFVPQKCVIRDQVHSFRNLNKTVGDNNHNNDT